MIYVITDGSCYKDQIGGWAALVITETGRKELIYGGSNKTTVNRCELLPVIKGLSFLYYKILKGRKGLPVTLISDSEYTIRTLSGEYDPSKNTELWEAANSIANRFQLRPVWRARNSHPYMEIVDAAAYAMREQYKKIVKEFEPEVLDRLKEDIVIDV